MATTSALDNIVDALADGVTATTQSAGDNSTKVATTAYADAASTNIATSDLTISSAGTRKLIMAGALATDIFTIRNSADTDDILKVQGDGALHYKKPGSFTNPDFNINFDYVGTKTAFNFTGTYVNSYARKWTFKSRFDSNMGSGLIISDDYTSQSLVTIVSNNVGIGVVETTISDGPGTPTADKGTVWMKNGTAPSASATDLFKMYSADQAAGNAAPHFRTENGSVIKLYQEAAATTVQDLADALTNQGLLASSTVTSPAEITVAVSDETTPLTTGTAKLTFRMPYAMTVTEVRASLSTAGTGAALLTVDINEGGVSILSTPITIDATEKTSTTAATAPVISDSSLADDAEITIDIDQVDTDNVAAGLKVTLIGTR